MKSDDPLFRPCQLVVGPDGALYVVDWRTDANAGNVWGDGVHGRIYRLTWSGTKEQPAIEPRPLDSWAKIEKQSDEDLLKTLSSEDASVRGVAQHEIVKRGKEQRPALLKLLQDKDQPLRAGVAALGALEAFWNADVQAAFLTVLRFGEPDMQRLAADGLGRNAKPGDEKVHALLLKNLSADELPVRRAVMLAIGRVNAPAPPTVSLLPSPLMTPTMCTCATVWYEPSNTRASRVSKGCSPWPIPGWRRRLPSSPRRSP